MKTWLTIINALAHDLFTGLWISTILVIYLLERKISAAHEMLVGPLGDVMGTFFWLGIFCIFMIIVTGIFRFFEYRHRYSSAPDPDRKKIKTRILILEHILLVLVFAGGTYLAYSYAFS
ncbi:MAG: hypothetical protein MUO43_09535 [Desulfobacterales bacterium]|nr:hypothetical protein [Desulfobacterales bacterium]